LGLIHNCTHIDALIEWIAYTHVTHAGFQLPQEPTGDVLLDQQAQPPAHLALVEPDSIDHTPPPHQVGILEDDEGDLPPSSSDSFFPEPAVWRRSVRPTSVDPVKAILSTSDE
jgi:hypothetical protein